VTEHFSARSEALKKASSQRRVSEGLRVTKPRNQPATRSKTSAVQGSGADTGSIAEEETRAGGDRTSQSSQISNDHHLARNIEVKRTAQSTERSSQDTYNGLQDYYTDTQLSDTQTHDYDNDFPNHYDTAHNPVLASSKFDDEDFDDDLDDAELLQLTSDMIDGISHGLPSSPDKFQISHRAYDDDEQAPGSSAIAPILVEQPSTKRTAKKFVSPITLTTRLLAATGDINTAVARKPIARPPFPVAVRDRSPIIGLSSSTLLRTCFRIGEVINQAHQASKTGTNIIFELYVRILESKRDDASQHFTFCDLFHGKPPYLKAEYDAAKWKSVQLFNYDSKRLLHQGRIARCMGKMNRDGKEWRMIVFNIFEVKWQDILWVEGIVNS
jgi:hypothetical protein